MVKLLILIHVLSAIIGVGPTFYGHVLVRKGQSVMRLRNSMDYGKSLEYFPKIGGTIALLTGIILVIVGNYGSFMQLWLVGSLLVYVYIQVLVIGFIAPKQKQLGNWLFNPENVEIKQLPDTQLRLYHKVNRLYWAASTGGVLLFALMIVRPILML